MKKHNSLKIHVSEKPPENWNEFLTNSPYASYYQTKEYAKYRKFAIGEIPIFLQIYKDTKIVGEILIFQTKFGLKKMKRVFGDGKIYSTFKDFSFKKNNYVWNYGPVTLKNFECYVMEELGNWISKNDFSFRGNTHPIFQIDFPEKFSFTNEKSGTFIIDLEEDLDTIFSKFNKNSVQKNIKRAEERGIMIKQINDENDVLKHYSLLSEHRKRNNLIVPSKKGMLENYRIGKNKGVTGFIALKENFPIASITVSYFNGYLVEQGISRSEIDIKEKLYGQELLRWNIIQWGKKNKYKIYDLAGIKLEHRDQKDDGIFKNKSKWNGVLKEYRTWSKQ